MDHKRLLKLIDEQKERGFTRALSGGGHYTVRRRGHYVATIAKTPGDTRSTKNALAQLRRAGLKVPR